MFSSTRTSTPSAWAISRNADGTLTGNGFRTDGGAPAFIMHGRIVQILSVVGLLAWLLVSPASAPTCGDPDSDGQTTVADGIQTLRAAALLSSSCVNATCDLDGSGSVNVNDGVNVLRKAAGLSAPNACLGSLECDASCVQAQAGSVVARIQGALEIGVAALPASAAVIAGTTPCPDGGFSMGDENGFTDVECREGDLVSNGSVAFSDIPPTDDRQATFGGLLGQAHQHRRDVGVLGNIDRQFARDERQDERDRHADSNLLGDYSDVFTDVVAEQSGDEVLLQSGTILTTVARGIGEFTSVKSLEGNSWVRSLRSWWSRPGRHPAGEHRRR